MNINKIIKLKNSKYKIITDQEEIITYDNVMLDNELLYKKNIDKTLYDKIVKDTLFYDIYNKAVKYILKKLRSEKEIRLYLSKQDISTSDTNKIIDKLKSINLINDREYTKAYINDHIYLNKQGINRIKKDLTNLDIDESIIGEELSKVDDTILNSNLNKIIETKIKHNKKYSNNELRMRITSEMVERGYDKALVINIIENNLTTDTDILDKEFDKIYNKLSKKYQGKELIIKLKQKLYSRGFTIEQINKKIED